MPSSEQKPTAQPILTGCEGYRVDTCDYRLGFLEEIRPACADRDHALLAVRAGAAGRRLLILPAGEVESVVSAMRLVIVRSSPRLCGTEPAPDGEGASRHRRVPGAV